MGDRPDLLPLLRAATGRPLFGGPWNLNLFGVRATTDPGRHWLSEPQRRTGCAVLPPGFYPWRLYDPQEGA